MNQEYSKFIPYVSVVLISCFVSLASVWLFSEIKRPNTNMLNKEGIGNIGDAKNVEEIMLENIDLAKAMAKNTDQEMPRSARSYSFGSYPTTVDLPMKVQKYLCDHGYSNAQNHVDFTLRDDGDERGIFIDEWHFPIDKPSTNDLPSDEDTLVCAISHWQESKPYMLKIVENNYVNFITNDWTLSLRNYGIIATNYTVTVTNTSEVGNITYLLTLKAYSKPAYYDMAGEFDRYKSVIVEYGGIMSEVISHDL